VGLEIGRGIGGNGELTDPDKIRAVDSDGVAAPDVLGVELVSSVLVHTSDYVELTSVIWMFWMMTASPRQQDSISLQQQPLQYYIPFLAPFAIRKPLPLSTPFDPTPIMLLLDPTLIPATPALS
jgi:hypothetical protein